mmetsp:Transcript_10048/g.21059  ORF Transcript_10048/g.21059 Transcript_10048/m.21059 type:complete len:230 (-) Transcript_10048:202-891(-)
MITCFNNQTISLFFSHNFSISILRSFCFCSSSCTLVLLEARFFPPSPPLAPSLFSLAFFAAEAASTSSFSSSSCSRLRLWIISSSNFFSYSSLQSSFIFSSSSSSSFCRSSLILFSSSSMALLVPTSWAFLISFSFSDRKKSACASLSLAALALAAACFSSALSSFSFRSESFMLDFCCEWCFTKNARTACLVFVGTSGRGIENTLVCGVFWECCLSLYRSGTSHCGRV